MPRGSSSQSVGNGATNNQLISPVKIIIASIPYPLFLASREFPYPITEKQVQQLKGVQSRRITSSVGMSSMAGISERVGDVLGAAVDAKLTAKVIEAGVPQHVAVIMDGNRRFAWRKSIPAKIGHRMGKEKLEKMMDWVLELNIPYLTVYALSTENITSRSKNELEILYGLYIEGLDDIRQDPRIHENKVKVKVIGHTELLPQNVIDAVDRAEADTAEYDDFTFTICLAYGSREEMVTAIRQIAADHASGKISLDEIDQKEVSSRLYTGKIPDPDLVIRTSGEERISNFLLWQAAYSELYFTDVFWPLFSRRDFLKAIDTYQQRKRRFGE